MKNVFIGCVAAISMFAMQFSQAETICDVKAGLGKARANVLKMLELQDKAQQEELKKVVDEASTALETALSAMLGDVATTEDVKVKLSEFNELWITFKDTRETEIIPAIYAGDIAKAKEVSSKVQAERMKVMLAAIAELGGDDCKEEAPQPAK